MMRCTGIRALLVLFVGLTISVKGSDYGDVFKRWDLGLDIHALSLQYNQGNSKVMSIGYGLTVGLNLPIIYGDSSMFTVGVNPSILIGSVSGYDNLLSVAVPLLATLKFNNDALIRPTSGWHVGGALGAGFTYNMLLPIASTATTLTDWIPTIMAEVNIGKRKSGFPGLIKIRFTKPLGEIVHEAEDVRYTTTHISVMFTTGF